MAKWGLLLLLLAFLSPPAASEATSCHPDDLHVLRAFAGHLSGNGAVLLRAAWSGASCCSWEGVGCDGTSGRVTVLWLPGRGLAGPIPASLAGVTLLKSLNLADNRLVGTIPSWLGELEHLCYLDLSDNSLVGEVPKSLVRLKGLNTDGRSPGMSFTKLNRRALAEQPNIIHGTNNHVISGGGNVVSGNDNTITSGNNNTLSGSHNTIVTGSDNVVTGSNQVVKGRNHVVTDNNNKVSGTDNNVSGSFHNVSGSHNTVSGSNNTVSGSNHVVSRDRRLMTWQWVVSMFPS